MKPRLLVPSIGRKVPLLRLLQERFEVFVSDANADAAGMLAVNEKHRIQDQGRDPNYLVDWVCSRCKRAKIGLVLPVRNEDVQVLSNSVSVPWLKYKGVRLLSSPGESVSACMDKYALAQRFPGIVPETLLKPVRFPCFAKPRYGSGSRGCGVVAGAFEFATIMNSGAEMVYQPAYGGTEVTVDLFLDRKHKLVQKVYRQRLTIRDGQTDHGRTIGADEVKGSDYALGPAIKEVLASLKFTGPINMQFLGSGDKFWLLDVNPRFSGGYPITHVAGADFVELLRQLVVGRKLTPRETPTSMRASGYTDYTYRKDH